jgi:hypothetical protein
MPHSFCSRLFFYLLPSLAFGFFPAFPLFGADLGGISLDDDRRLKKEISVTVSGPHEIELYKLPFSVTGYTVTNSGDTLQSFKIITTIDPEVITTKIKPDKITLIPGEKASIIVELIPQKNHSINIANPHSLILTFKAKSISNSRILDSIQTTIYYRIR